MIFFAGIPNLSADIALKPGELRIEFFGAEDLAAKAVRAVAGDGQRLASPSPALWRKGFREKRASP